LIKQSLTSHQTQYIDEIISGTKKFNIEITHCRKFRLFRLHFVADRWV